MEEARNRHAGLAEPAVGSRPEIAAADAVDEHPHLHAAPLGLDQRLVKGLPRGVGPKDVALEADAHAGPADLLQHAGIGLIAVAQGFDLVAVLARQPGQPTDGEFQRRQRIVGRHVGRCGFGDGGLRAGAKQPLGAALDAIDAHDRVQDAADEG